MFIVESPSCALEISLCSIPYCQLSVQGAVFLSLQSWLCFVCPETCFWRICLRGVSLSIFIVSLFGRFSSSQRSSSDEKSHRSLISYWIWMTFSKYFSYFFAYLFSDDFSEARIFMCIWLQCESCSMLPQSRTQKEQVFFPHTYTLLLLLIT